ncbi:hypothetical protein ASF60_19790 [Methylobacterium sp. Leaf113]|uniref:DNA-directed RNA polymerase n=1 Tax=Methylobacterium sp. Leaf113 TaxID=1736259 RepID=UPI0006F56A31|nr:DNA-directed RNA polymerase [Methylobacterium sp. Leaf113]KQP89366.1 hypothetical protein ASF60_19790 [Methylobacterium sp. Leaf113]
MDEHQAPPSEPSCPNLFTFAHLRPWQRINAEVHRVALAASQLDIAPPALHRAARLPFVQHRPGADPIGGMVEFATPQPVTSDNGADGWLMVHLAACFGQTSGSHEHRMAWVLGQEPLWRRIASDPLGATEWAAPEIADPWSALAAAIEWVRFLDVGFGMGSRLPVVLQAGHLEGLMPELSPTSPLTSAEHDAIAWACREAREAGVEVADGRSGVFGVHATNAWTVAHYLKTGIELARGA